MEWGEEEPDLPDLAEDLDDAEGAQRADEAGGDAEGAEGGEGHGDDGKVEERPAVGREAAQPVAAQVDRELRREGPREEAVHHLRREREGERDR